MQRSHRLKAADRRCTTALVAAFAVTAPLAACGPGPDEGLERSSAERVIITPADAPASADAVAATEQLGLLALRSTAEPEDNILVSPASLSFALALLAEGANGETATSLDAALGASGADRTSAYNALAGALAKHDGDPDVAQDDELPDEPVLHLANQAVLDDELAVEQSYLDALASAFDAGVQRTDLGSGEGKKVLDSWVDHHTGGLIERSAIDPEPSLRLVLQNAVLLAARWQVPFEEHSTSDQSFTGPDSTDPADVTPETLTALTTALDTAPEQTVGITMPTLELDPPVLDLAPALDEASLGGLYDAPDLSGISTTQDLAVSQAVQQAYLSLDEGGTVAAAVTEVGVRETSAGPTEPAVRMTVDRPYLLRIAHTETSLALFLAAVRSPQH